MPAPPAPPRRTPTCRDRPSARQAAGRRLCRLRLAQGAHRLLALLAGDPIEDQDPVEMVDLVLDHARLEPRGLDRQRVTGLVLAAHEDMDRPLDVDMDAGQ